MAASMGCRYLKSYFSKHLVWYSRVEHILQPTGTLWPAISLTWLSYGSPQNFIHSWSFAFKKCREIPLAGKAPLAKNTNLQEREVTIVLHVCNLQVAEYHLTVVVHPLQTGEMVFHMSQLGQLVICPLTNCRGKKKAPWRKARTSSGERVVVHYLYKHHSKQSNSTDS